MRDFKKWVSKFKKTLAGWDYYTDFSKVYNKVSDVKVELNILNSLIGEKNIEDKFVKIIEKYPECLKTIPLLLAKRGREILINDLTLEYDYDFENRNYSIEEYVKFMRLSGLFELMQNHLINNIVDYVTGIEVGLDSNARKNRTGKLMEKIVKDYLDNCGYVEGEDYFSQMKKSKIHKTFGIDFKTNSTEKKADKRFDFVVLKGQKVYAIECNFYSGGGSKLNETARSYKNLFYEYKDVENFSFVWVTDGIGWRSALENLEEIFSVFDFLFNIDDLDNDELKKIIK